MSNLIRALCMFLCGVFVGPAAAEEGEAVPIRLVIGLDLSKSNPLTENQAYAGKLADFVAEEIDGLRLGAEVQIRTFGVSDATRNTLRIDEQVTLRNPPSAISAAVKKLVSSIPALVSSGRLEAQDATNIVGFLRTSVQSIGECQTPTRFILLTDGLEDSEYGRLTGSGGALTSPVFKPPKDKRYKCDELLFLGIGQGLASQSERDRLAQIWREWVAHSAPFKAFTPLQDW